METYTIKAKIYGDHSLLIFDKVELAYRWLMHDDGSHPVPPPYGIPANANVVFTFIYGAKGLQSFIDEYFNPDIVKLEIL